MQRMADSLSNLEEKDNIHHSNPNAVMLGELLGFSMGVTNSQGNLHMASNMQKE